MHPLLLHGTASAEPTCALAAKLPLATTPSLALAVALWMRAAASEVIGVRPPLVLPLLPPLLHWQAASCAVLRSASLCIVQQVACIQVSSGAGSVDLVHSDKLAQDSGDGSSQGCLSQALPARVVADWQSVNRLWLVSTACMPVCLPAGLSLGCEDRQHTRLA